jgi:hypothetical protein
MATSRQNIPTVAGLIEPNLQAMGKTLNERIAEAQAKGDTKEVERLNLAAGLTSAATGLATGLPDLTVMGYNWATSSNVKDLRTRVLEATGVPTSATDKANELTYNAPEYAVMAWGIGNLLKSGWKGLKSWKESRRAKEFLKTLPPQQANRFSQFMMNGQGSNDPMVIAALDQLKRDPKYAELFTTLDKAATESAIKAMTPRPSRLSPQVAAEKTADAVSDKLTALKKARDSAGDVSFNKAFALAGDRPIVNTTETLSELRKLSDRYSKSKTPAGQSAFKFIQGLQDDLLNNPNKTVQEFQSMLSEFGKRTGQGDSLVNSLTSVDEKIISSAVFGGLKKDLAGSIKAAANPQDKQALGALVQARTKYASASDDYNKLIGQGIPAFLEGKSISEITPEVMLREYKKLNSGQRTLFRDWVSAKSPEALQFLDNRVFTDFLAKSYKDLPDGTKGYDLGTLARSWQDLMVKKPGEADMLAKSLGTNASEFNARMKDALVFTRKMELGGKFGSDAEGFISGLRRSAQGVVGSTALGYQGAKATDLSLQIAESLFKKTGLNSEQMMKALLSKEGAEFLKQASLSPNSQKTLEALTNFESAFPALRTSMAIGGVTTGAGERPVMGAEAESDVYIPEDITSLIAAPVTPQSPLAQEPMGVAPVEAPVEDMGEVFIPDDLLPQQTQQQQQQQQQPQQPQEVPVQQQMPMSPLTQGPAGLEANEEQALSSVLQTMQARDPNLNVDYVRNAYMKAPPEKRKQFINVYMGQ